MKSKRVDAVEELIKSSPNGVTRKEIESKLNINRQDVYNSISMCRKARKMKIRFDGSRYFVEGYKQAIKNNNNQLAVYQQIDAIPIVKNIIKQIEQNPGIDSNSLVKTVKISKRAIYAYISRARKYVPIVFENNGYLIKGVEVKQQQFSENSTDDFGEDILNKIKNFPIEDQKNIIEFTKKAFFYRKAALDLIAACEGANRVTNKLIEGTL